ncbi:type II toxin-antitoxin system HicA family toxin [Marvinbryantia formatexigens]|nr:type II toxin-antitoxin system HicA family toxin [Marvinbryantia formatexigens]UWO23161.1 type II toxin-antitoxin system HicA family toxin [Marvinbryantia formatexigens DSM 14469]
MKTSELIRMLKKYDCFFVEHGKEHDKWHSVITGKDFRIPSHRGKEIPMGTVSRILKDAGLKS